MNVGKAVVVSVLLSALGVASGAELDDVVSLFDVEAPWVPLGRDPFEFRAPGREPIRPGEAADVGKLVQEAEDLIARGEIAAAEEQAAEALEALRAQGAEDSTIQARLFTVFKKIGDVRTEVGAIEEFRDLHLRLSGVAWNESNPVALVDGELCVPGDVVKGAKIDSIRSGEVVFVFKGVRLRMSVQHPGIERVEGSREAGEAGERE